MERLSGKVIRFNARRGWGFIREETEGKDYFCHYSNIVSKHQFRNVNDGDKVFFNPSVSHKGLEAKQVRLVSEELLENGFWKMGDKENGDTTE